MTRRRTPDPAGQDAARRIEADPRDAYTPESYRRQFRREIWTWRMDPACFPALIAAMQAGEPLTCDEATAITGVSPPPLDAVG